MVDIHYSSFSRLREKAGDEGFNIPESLGVKIHNNILSQKG